MKQAVYISEAGAYRALANVIMSRGHDVSYAKKHGRIIKVEHRRCFIGYGVKYEGRILEEGV